MNDSSTTGIVTILLAIAGVATISVVLSRQSNTASILTTGGSSFSQAIRCALSPIIGGGNCGTAVNSTISFG
jgi:hypothetical protein